MRPVVDKESLARYHAAVHYSVGSIIEDHTPDSEETDVKKFNRETIAAIAQIVSRKIGILANDLEAFARHAKRSKVTTDDVILCARRNPSLAKKLKDFANRAKDEKQDKLSTGSVPTFRVAAAAGTSCPTRTKQRQNLGEVIDLSNLE